MQTDDTQRLVSRFRSHAPQFWHAMEDEDHGAGLNAIGAFQIPALHELAPVFWIVAWEHAIELGAVRGMHRLALSTPREMLHEAWFVGVERHDAGALTALAPRIKRELIDRGAPLMGHVSCVHDDSERASARCSECAALRSVLVRLWAPMSLPRDGDVIGLLDDDFAQVRAAWRAAVTTNHAVMRRPLLSTSPKTDAVFGAIQSRVRSGWTTVAVAAVAVAMWSRWVERQCRPGSRFVRARAARFAAQCGQSGAGAR